MPPWHLMLALGKIPYTTELQYPVRGNVVNIAIVRDYYPGLTGIRRQVMVQMPPVRFETQLSVRQPNEMMKGMLVFYSIVIGFHCKAAAGKSGIAIIF